LKIYLILAIHIACALHAGADIFFSTDFKLLKAASVLEEIRVLNPLDWIKEGFI
jgi:predicted nucleic acid-binding protein